MIVTRFYYLAFINLVLLVECAVVIMSLNISSLYYHVVCNKCFVKGNNTQFFFHVFFFP